MTTELGLRERKKQQMRETIRQTALRLFAERGFEAVTVTEVAREPNVSQATVFNYFPTKEDLFYQRMEVFEDGLLRAVRGRRPGQSVLAAFRDFVLTVSGVLAEDQATEQVATFARIVLESPALLEREQQIFSRYTQSLAALLAEETETPGDDIQPWVVANALIGVHRALLEYVRRGSQAGRSNPDLSRDVHLQGERAFALLERGFGDYAVKRMESIG
jgi:AcrR family transcriptional regulator